MRYIYLLLLAALASCYFPPEPASPLMKPSPLTQALPTSLASSSLLPPGNPPIVLSAQLKSGEVLGPGFYLSKEYAASLGGELERLAGLAPAYQEAERAQAALIVAQGNQALELMSSQLEAERAARLKAEEQALRLHKALKPVALGSAALGMLLTSFLLLY